MVGRPKTAEPETSAWLPKENSSRIARKKAIRVQPKLRVSTQGTKRTPGLQACSCEKKVGDSTARGVRREKDKDNRFLKPQERKGTTHTVPTAAYNSCANDRGHTHTHTHTHRAHRQHLRLQFNELAFNPLAPPSSQPGSGGRCFSSSSSFKSPLAFSLIDIHHGGEDKQLFELMHHVALGATAAESVHEVEVHGMD
eukprot:790389-Pelagomonas_calceolata.AAC.5